MVLLLSALSFFLCMSLIMLQLCEPGRVKFKLKSDTNLFEIVKCKTTVSAVEVCSPCSLLSNECLSVSEHTSIFFFSIFVIP